MHANETGAEYARRIHAERVAAGYCPECRGHGTITVPHTTTCGIQTDRQITCPKCNGTKRAK